MDKYTEPYSAKINHKLQDTVGTPPLRCDDGLDYLKITEGKYTVVLTVEEAYYQEYDEQGVALGLVLDRLYLVSNAIKH